MFQQKSKSHKAFKSKFIQKLFAMIDKNCDETYLEQIHLRTWNIFWHISQFITLQNGFDEKEIEQIVDFLCNLCYAHDRSLSSTQRQWITLSIIRIIVQTPQCISILYKEHKIIHRKSNLHIWLMYALGDCASKLVQKYQSKANNISKKSICDTLESIISILMPYTTNNYGLIRTTSQYFYHQCVEHLLSIDSKFKTLPINAMTMKLYETMRDLPDSIKLRKRLKVCFKWLERGNCVTFNAEQNIQNEDVEIKENESKENKDEQQIEDKLLRMSRNKTWKETESMQEEIIDNILSEHSLLNMNDEILWLIKHRIGSNQGFTERLSSALSNVLLSTFEYYTDGTIQKNDDVKDANHALVEYQRKIDPLMNEYHKLLKTEKVRGNGSK